MVPDEYGSTATWVAVGVGLLLAIEPIIDMGRTAVNVTGQAVVAAVVSTREKILDKDVWDAGKEAAPAAA